MSKMLIVVIDDNAKAMEALAAFQDAKVLAYPTGNGTFKRAPILAAYLTDAKGGIKLP